MYKIGLVITAKVAGRDLIRQLAFRKVCLIESDDTEGELRVIYNNIDKVNEGSFPIFHVIHLRFAKLSRRELNNQLRFLSAHPFLFTRMVLLICEVHADLSILYHEIARSLTSKSPHRINMDYFLVLCNKTADDIYHILSESDFLCKSALDYFQHLCEPGQYLIIKSSLSTETLAK